MVMIPFCCDFARRGFVDVRSGGTIGELMMAVKTHLNSGNVGFGVSVDNTCFVPETTPYASVGIGCSAPAFLVLRSKVVRYKVLVRGMDEPIREMRLDGLQTIGDIKRGVEKDIGLKPHEIEVWIKRFLDDDNQPIPETILFVLPKHKN